MDRKHLLVAIAILGIIGAGVRLYRHWPGRAPRIELDSYQALGVVAAREASRLAGPKGQVVVIARENRSGANPAEAAQLAAFTDALKDKAGITLAGTETFSLTALQEMSGGGSVSRNRFVKALRDHPAATVLVLFTGFPSLESADLDWLAREGPKIVLISGYRPGYKALLEAGVIDAAIVSRFDTPPEDLKTPTTLQEWFDHDYVLITPAQAPGLPY